jgi:hypothetical protein
LSVQEVHLPGTTSPRHPSTPVGESRSRSGSGSGSDAAGADSSAGAGPGSTDRNGHKRGFSDGSSDLLPTLLIPIIPTVKKKEKAVGTPWNHVIYARNNVEVSSSSGALDEAVEEGRASLGYLQVMARDDAWEIKLESQDSLLRIADLKLCWTSNQNLVRSTTAPERVDGEVELPEPKPLPPGWDSAYDPITGENYYIDHATQTTTWDYPGHLVLTDADTEGVGGDADGKVNSGSGSYANGAGDPRPWTADSTEVDLLSVAPSLVAVWRNPVNTDAGCVAISCGLPGVQPGCIIFMLKRGVRFLSAALRRCSGCRLVIVPSRNLLGQVISPDPIAASVWDEPATPLPWDDTPTLDATNDHIPLETWYAALDEEGQVRDWKMLQKLVYFRGLRPELRTVVWPYLLQAYTPELTREGKDLQRRELNRKYEELKLEWQCVPTADSRDCRHQLKNIAKDVVRTDRDHPLFSGEGNPVLKVMMDIIQTYCHLHPGFEYYQGMTDLLATTLIVTMDEAITFYCFCNQMDRLGNEFGNDGQAVDTKLQDLGAMTKVCHPEFYAYLQEREMHGMLFAYRWILLDFRREFTREEVFQLWETLWCQQRCKDFNLLVALAIIEMYIPTEAELADFNFNVLAHFSHLALSMDFEVVLRKARDLVYTLNSPNHGLPQETWNRVFGEHRGLVAFGDGAEAQAALEAHYGLIDDLEAAVVTTTENGTFAADAVALAAPEPHYGLLDDLDREKGNDPATTDAVANGDNGTDEADDSPDLETAAAAVPAQAAAASAAERAASLLSMLDVAIRASSTPDPAEVTGEIDERKGNEGNDAPAPATAAVTPTAVVPVAVAPHAAPSPARTDRTAMPSPVRERGGSSSGKYSGNTIPTVDTLPLMPTKIAEAVKAAFVIDGASDRNALAGYMHAIDLLLDQIRHTGKDDAEATPAATKAMKRCAKHLLLRAEYLKESI